MPSTDSGAAAPPAPAAVLRDVRFSYDGGASWALDGVSLDVAAGDYVCLTGPNGSGKSTLARLLAGLAAPDEGTVALLGQTVFDGGAHPDRYRIARRSLGAVFQHPDDQIVTTVVRDDVAFGPENLGLERALIGGRIADALAAVGLSGHGGDDPTRMSGGQQQRVAIAGMLAMAPSMLVLDEPTAMLDPSARADVLRILDELHARGTTIIHVTHHADEAARAGRVIRLDCGRIVAGMPAGDTAAVSQRGHAPDDTTTPSRLRRQPAPAGAGTGASVKVHGVRYRYPGADRPVFDDLSLHVDAGETVAIMGANGAGKTTLLRLLCALEQPDAGSITVAGVPVAAARGQRAPRRATRRQRATLRRRVGLVMQHPERQLFADTVAEDVAYGPRNQHLDEAEVARRVDQALRLLHIEHLADRTPFSLSGGQQRLAAIAGVIACRPRVLIMDEPTASLDAAATARIHELIRTLHDQGVTVIIVTHAPDEARALAGRIITLGASDMSGATGATEPSDRAEDSAEPSAASGLARGRGGTGSRATPPVSWIARLDPRVKMVAFLTMMVTAFAIGTPMQLALGAAAVAAIVAAARLAPLRLLGSARVFLAMFVLMGLLNVLFVRSGTVLAQLGPVPITDDGLVVALIYACRFALVIILGAVLIATTTPTALTDGFASLLAPLARFGVHAQELALVMSLALRFLPTLGAETQAVVDAQAARGGQVESGSPAARLRALVAICVPVFAGTLRHADHLGLALDARCYEAGIRRTHWRELRVRGRDLAFIGAVAGYLVALFALGALH